MSKFFLPCFLLFAPPVTALAQEGLAPWRKGDVAPTGSFSFSLEYDRIFLRDLDERSLSGTEFNALGMAVDTIDADVKTDNVELESNSFFLRSAYSLYAPEDSPFGIEAYFLLGGADVELDGRVREPGNPSNDLDVEGDFDLAVGGGLRARIWSIDSVRILSDFSIRWSNHESDIGKVDNLDLDIGAGETASQDFETDVLSWQLSLYASYSVEVGNILLAPYAGFHFSGVDVEIDGEQDFFDPAFDGTQTIRYRAEESDIFGIFVGAEAVFTENISAILEFRLIDEYAVTLGAGYSF